MKNLGYNLLNRLGSLHSNQALIETTMKEGEVIGVQSKLIQNGGVQAADMKFIIHGPAAKLIGRTNGHSPFNSSTCLLYTSDAADE